MLKYGVEMLSLLPRGNINKFMAFTRQRNPIIEQGHRYYDCDRCGVTFHIRDTVVQNGLRVCKETCKDDLSNQKRW
jgi:formylmethanofuran dehydrogenase subunit E